MGQGSLLMATHSLESENVILILIIPVTPVINNNPSLTDAPHLKNKCNSKNANNLGEGVVWRPPRKEQTWAVGCLADGHMTYDNNIRLGSAESY